MAIIVGVRFQNAGKLYYFDPLDTGAAAGDTVIVETARGKEMGEAVTGPTEVADEDIIPPLRPVIRVATAEDIAHKEENAAREKDAFVICKQKIAEHQLPMKLVSCEYTFDNAKLLFYFTSDSRVDFRALVKDLASVFHVRIELRQIGVRDEARMMGGLGICGRPLCCSQFLGDFHPVSIKMAKEQNLSLNPTKISGACGRLMCCLQYEEEYYEKTSRAMPRVGKMVHTPDGDGPVADVNILKETVRVRLSKGNDMTELRDYPVSQVQRLTGGPAPQNDKPAEAEQDDSPDPEIMQALRASEMDVPDEDAGVALPPDDAEQPAPEKRPPARRKPYPRAARPSQPPAADGRTSAADSRTPGAAESRTSAAPQKTAERPPRPGRRPYRAAPKPASIEKPAPVAPAAPVAPVAPAAPAAPAAPKRDPWHVPDEFRQKT